MEFSLYFNCVYIIQSLPDDEPQTGTSLINTIKYCSWKRVGLSYKLIEVSSYKELYSAFHHINEAFFNNQLISYIHFELHGCKEGLSLKNGQLVPWKVLRPTLSQINYNVENNLFISLATCFGAYIFNAVELLERIPFIGFVGPAYEINIGEVQTDWTLYFENLLLTNNFYDAIKSLKLSNDRVPYTFFPAEQIWDIYCKAYLKMFVSRKDKRTKLISLHRNSKNFPELKKYSHAELDGIFKSDVSNQKIIMEEVREYFMLRSDKLPFL